MEGNTVSKAVPKKSKALRRGPRSRAIAAAGISTGNDFALLMSALMSDLIEGRITPAIGNACCNAGGKLLKVVELQFKYGMPSATGERTLGLVGNRIPVSPING